MNANALPAQARTFTARSPALKAKRPIEAADGSFESLSPRQLTVPGRQPSERKTEVQPANAVLGIPDVMRQHQGEYPSGSACSSGTIAWSDRNAASRPSAYARTSFASVAGSASMSNHLSRASSSSGKSAKNSEAVDA